MKWLSKNLTEAEEIKKRWQEYTEKLYRKGLNEPDNHDGVVKSPRARHPGVWSQVGLQFSRSVMSEFLQPHGLQHARPPCPSPSPGVYSNSCPLSQWCHPTILSSVIPFSFFLQFFPASGSFHMSPFLASGGQSIGVSASASVLPMNI